MVGFGSFMPVDRAGRHGAQPAHRRARSSAPASKTARFRVGEGLKTALN